MCNSESVIKFNNNNNNQNSAKFDNSAVYISFNIVTKLFGVWVVNYEVMDLQTSDKCNRG